MNTKSYFLELAHTLPKNPVSEKDILKRLIKQIINTTIALIMATGSLMLIFILNFKDDITGLVFISIITIFLLLYLISMVYKVKNKLKLK